MPNNQIEKGYDFTTGQLVTADNLDNLAQEATLKKGAISEQPPQTEPLVDADEILVNDVSDTATSKPKKATIAQVFNSKVEYVAKTINAPAGESITLTPNDGTIVTGNAFSSVDGLNVLVNRADHGLTVGQLIEVSEAISGVVAKPAYNGKYKVTEVTSTSVFVYRLDVTTDPITGTLSYKKEGSVVINNNLQVNGESRFSGNLRFDSGAKVSGNLEFLNGNLQLPNGTTAQRPTTPLTGVQRFNTTTNRMEFYNGTEWVNVVQSAATEALIGWLFLGYQVVEFNGSTAASGTGSRTLPLFEHNIAIPEGEYWMPMTDFAINSQASTTDMTLEEACVVTDAYNATHRANRDMVKKQAEMSMNFAGKKISSARTPISSPSLMSFANYGSNDPVYDGRVPYGGSFSVAMLSGDPNDLYVGTMWAKSYIAWNTAPTTTTNAYEANLHQNAFICLFTNTREQVYWLGTGDSIEEEFAPSASAALFYLIPQQQTSPDANGTIWISEKGVRGGQNLKLRRKAITYQKNISGIYQERFVLVFERWKRA